MQARMNNPAMVGSQSHAGPAGPGRVNAKQRPERRDCSNSSICAPARSTAAASASTGILASPRRPAKPTSACSPWRPGATRLTSPTPNAPRFALTEAVTRLSDRADPVPDEIWNEAARHYDEPTLAVLLIAIANINVWNRLNVATRQPAGVWKP